MDFLLKWGIYSKFINSLIYAVEAKNANVSLIVDSRYTYLRPIKIMFDKHFRFTKKINFIVLAMDYIIGNIMFKASCRRMVLIRKLAL